MKKISILTTGLVLFLAAGFFAALPAFGQAAPSPLEKLTPDEMERLAASGEGRMASVSVHDAEITSQEGGRIRVAFDISNGADVQPQVRYAVSLMKKVAEGSFPEYETVYGEVLSLGVNETVHKEIEYAAPDFLKGEWDLWIVSKNWNGLTLGAVRVDKVKFEGSGEQIRIMPEKCYLEVVDGSGRKYPINKGVDVDKDEALEGHCEIASTFKQTVSVIPMIDMYKRTSFGEKLSSGKEPVLSLGSGENKNVRYVISLPEMPQAYDAVLYFADGAGKTISNALNFHFVVRGKSATLQNVRLDKDYYAKGESANVLLRWASSADNFPDSRGGKGTELSSVKLDFTIKNSSGEICASASDLDPSDDTKESKFSISISRDCFNPSVAVTLKDGGKALDVQNYSIETKSRASEEEKTENVSDDWNFRKIVMIGSIILPLLVICYLAFRRRKSNLPLQAWFLAVALSSGVLLGGRAMAVPGQTIDVIGYNHGEFISTVYFGQLDKAVYDPGAVITASGNGTGGHCSNGWQGMDLTVNLPGGSGGYIIHMIGTLVFNFPWPTQYGSLTFSAPSLPGNYNATFCGATQDASATDGLGSGGGTGILCFKEPFRVRGCGDGVCQPAALGETCSTCPTDCGVCPACTGAVPDNATLCSGDDTGLSADTSRSLVPACTATKCEYTCNSGYILNGGVCVLAACTGAIPDNATLCSGDSAGLVADTALSLVAACSAPAGSSPKCEYVCNSGFKYDGNNGCVPISCTPPSGCSAWSGSSMCSGDNSGLTGGADISWRVVTGCTPAQKCECLCSSDPEEYACVRTAPDCGSHTCQNATGSVTCQAKVCGGWVSRAVSDGKCGDVDCVPDTLACPCQNLNWREVQP